MWRVVWVQAGRSATGLNIRVLAKVGSLHIMACTYPRHVSNTCQATNAKAKCIVRNFFDGQVHTPYSIRAKVALVKCVHQLVPVRVMSHFSEWPFWIFAGSHGLCCQMTCPYLWSKTRRRT